MNDPQTSQTPSMESIRHDVMDAIHKGKVQMRPRWHFFLLSGLTAIGTLILLLALFYIASLSVFFLRDNGVFFAPSFGMRGWFSLMHSIPWLMVVLAIPFLILLEILVRRYSFIYRKPLLVSLVGIVLVVAIGGYAIAQTSFHRQMQFFARHNQLPAPLGAVYSAAVRPLPPPDAYYGAIVSITKDGFTIFDDDHQSTTSVIVTAATRLPYGANFTLGESVFVIGDTVATGTVRAFGVREADE